MVFNLRYRNEQGVLMRILNAVSRRGLDFDYVHAEDGMAVIITPATKKQQDQLRRDWNAVIGVEHVF